MKKELDVTRFEPLESDGDVLRGGFSAVYGGPGMKERETPGQVEDTNYYKCVTNNCHIQNCGSAS
ncbi:MAG: hypothetical protein V6Z82_00585 [Flavobacteriales bacterium]